MTFEIAFDFVEHAVLVRTSGGEERRIEQRDGQAVADFDVALRRALGDLGLDVTITGVPFGTPVSDIPFAEDRVHASYDPDGAHAFWRATDWSAGALDEFSGWFCGKQSPVELFWHSFDLALARYSGRRAPGGGGARTASAARPTPTRSWPSASGRATRRPAARRTTPTPRPSRRG